MLITYSMFVSLLSCSRHILVDEHVTTFTVDPGRQTESHWQVQKLFVKVVVLTTCFFSIYCILLNAW